MNQESPKEHDDIYPQSVQRVDLKPGDRLVIYCDDYLSSEAVAKIESKIVQWFGSDKVPPVLVLSRGMQLAVIGKGEPDEQ